MQTILGAGGVIGNGLLEELPHHSNKIRIVSRAPRGRGQGNAELVKADITNYKQTEEAVKGSEVVYLTIGLKYSSELWRIQWPLIMNNVIDACKKHGSKLVFFDNVYMLGKVDGWMTEETPVNPCSVKGEIRAEIAQKLMDEVKAGNINALIARSADFYGPGAVNTVYHMLVCQKFKEGKSASILCNSAVKHSLTFVQDAARATALLGNTSDAYNQIWHLPTDKNALTGRELVKMTAAEFGAPANYSVLKKWMVKLAGIFNPTVGESYEMLYQNEYDYLFDSSKYEKHFSIKPVSYSEGIAKTVAWYKGQVKAAPEV